ncbi:amidase [Rhizobium sp. K1/93]|nr:amidase [Rhizobium sp. L58/93]MBO9182769.1 amidase [Rhizobium sp. E27B/91]QXZ86394.1 amidase [Rhizobium sp. K1/93]QXZ92151.1 amidase [Rhizobium sp. K15/93]
MRERPGLMAKYIPQTIAQIHSSFADDMSPVTLVEDCLRRIDELNDSNGAMIFVARNEALEEARQAEAAMRAGKRLGPLHGIPIAVKDVIDVRGCPTTAGSRLFETAEAEDDAVCVANLRAAGAIIIGKANLHELTAGNHDNPWFGKVVNPLDTERGTGGTSSGSAAAVAAGFCVAAIGTDTGGSNRSVAAATGLVGFKPTNGAVDADGTLPTAPTFDSIGPITTCVADARLVHYSMMGICAPSEISLSLSEITIGVCPDLYDAAIDPAVAAVHEKFFASAQSAGAQVKVLSFRHAREVREAGLTILMYEFTSRYHGLVATFPERVGAAVQNFLSKGAEISEKAYQSALAYRMKIDWEFEELLSEVNVLATPVVPGLAPRLSDEMTAVGSGFVPYGLAGGHFRRWANFFGMPTLAMPLLTPGPLPASIQITTPKNTENYLFSVCNALSRLETGSAH